MGVLVLSSSLSLEHLGEVVSAMGTRDFGTRFFDLFSSALSVEQCTVFAFEGTQAPDPIITEGSSAERRQIASSLAQDYIAGAYASDPNLLRREFPLRPTIHSLSASEVRDRPYRMRFYVEPCLAHELVVLGEFKGIRYYSSFYRTDGRAEFGAEEIDLLTGVAGFALRAIHRHRELTLKTSAANPWATRTPGGASSPRERAQMMKHICSVLLAEPGKLSQREAQVCAGIILGYTAVGISLTVGIAVNTVTTHRKRAYRKLEISSQNELLARYFRTVNQYDTRS